MSLSEYGALTETELAVLSTARAFWLSDTGFVIEDALNESDARAAARRLAMRGLGECFIHDTQGETFRINSKGFAYLTENANG